MELVTRIRARKRAAGTRLSNDVILARRDEDRA
jgi:hypothetical protein